MSATLTQQFAKFAYNLKYNDIPSKVTEKVKTAIMHGISIGLAGHHMIYGQIAREVVFNNPTPLGGEATLLGVGGKASVMDAAFAGSSMFHGRVQEDTHGTTHVGTICIPLTIALAEKERKSGKDVITALTAAYEISAAIGKDYTKYSTPKGFRASSIYGIFGAATVSGLMLGLTEEQLTNALGFASAFAFGTTESFAQGTMEWRFEVGLAARNGMMAALLAKSGAVAAPNALEGRMGFYNAFTGITENLEEVTKNLGKVWETMNVTFKYFPVCAFNQTQTLNTIGIVGENGIDPAKIKSITVKMSEYEANYPGQKNWGPFNNFGQTTMSVPFAVAGAVLYGKLTLAIMHDFENPDIIRLVDKVKVIGTDEVGFLCSHMTVEMEDGTVYNRNMDVTEEFYSLDFDSDVKLIKGIADEMPISMERIEGLIDAVAKLDQAENVDDLIQKSMIK